VLDILLRRILSLGVRTARAGEFSERAFLNGKIDLSQAEAIADLIAADSHEAARAAINSLQGDFSEEIHRLVEQLTQLRIHVESALDFPEEEIDFLADKSIAQDLSQASKDLLQVKKSAQQGRLLKEGMSVVIAGKPNAGKSSLLNQLAGQDAAIVTDIAGTTRDILREHIQIDGLPLHIIDTAGLRESDNEVEQEGVRRALHAMKNANRLLYVIDDSSSIDESDVQRWLPDDVGITFVHNKIDINQTKSCISKNEKGDTSIFLSAKTGEGMDLLRRHLKSCMGYENRTQGSFIARRRHLEAIDRAQLHLMQADQVYHEAKAGELLAEELKLAQQALSTITGEFSSDDLLGRIFSEFCIGK